MAAAVDSKPINLGLFIIRCLANLRAHPPRFDGKAENE
jgi:hypothetical protein